ncbi:HNH endonuclease [Nocardioidaceae bacterium SCSIO 66511]|nr:HNH endonuclease [Nocardioidaceae bacterium SCSIO 66511]
MTIPVEPADVQCADDEGVAALHELLTAVTSLPYADSDTARIDRIALLEKARGALAAAQALEMVEFEESQIATQREAGVAERNVGRGVADQVALARGLSPARGSRELSWVRALVKQLPETRRLLAAGKISEVTARAMVTETAELRVEDRRRVDSDLAPDLPAMVEREARAAARKAAYALDPEAATRRARKARKDRRVSIRPAPDTMTLVTGLLPVEQGVAAWASLKQAAASAKASGDERTQSQIMADTFVERLTGQTAATGVPVEVHLTMSAETMCDEDDGPADVHGHGPVPADIARDIIRDDTVDPANGDPRPTSANVETSRDDAANAADDPTARRQVNVWLRRVFDDPASGVANDIDPGRRRFTGAVARYLFARDKICRTPGCGASIRHLDHVRPYRDGGATVADNGQGLCERCSYTKEMPGWTTVVTSAETHTTTITTPTGHSYASRPPPANGYGPSARTLSARRRDRRLARLRTRWVMDGVRPPGDSAS